MSFSIGDAVVYGGTGVCKIDEIKDVSFFHERPQKHYILTPLFVKQPSTVYVPFNNEKLVSKMKPVITRAEAEQLIKYVKINDGKWIDDRNARKEQFINCLANGTHKEIIDLIGVITTRREELLNEGKTLNMQDEKILNDAERRMTAELAVALEIEPEDVKALVRKELGK
ncbi:MAG: CarD family transcriptional regulator [Bacillota bacterium]|nr:CarD family transcriptional regulator [Bacillota bacterium]